MKKGDFAIIIVLVIAAITGSIYMFIRGNQSGSKYIVITHDQEVIERFKFTNDYKTTYRFEHDGEYNVIYVEDGKVWIEEANCNNQVCVYEQPIKLVGQAIVCLPHKLIVEIQGADESTIDIISE